MVAESSTSRLRKRCGKCAADGLAETVFKTFHEEPTIYLLPKYEDSSTQQGVLEEFWPDILEAMLGRWVTDEALWPKNRTFEMFHQWFEVQMSSIVEDLYLDERLSYLD